MKTPTKTSKRNDAPLLRRPGRPPRIDRESILAATIDMALPDLTLTAVAKRLGVSTQALYRYFANREALIDAVIQLLTERYPLPNYQGEDWCIWAHKWGSALYQLYQALPGMAERATAGTPNVPAVLTRFETSIRIAHESGFDELFALWATQTLTEFVHTWVARDQKRTAIAMLSGMTYKQSLQAVVDARAHIDLPLFSAALKHSEPISEDVRFDYSLRCLLNGISAQRHAPHELNPALPNKKRKK